MGNAASMSVGEIASWLAVECGPTVEHPNEEKSSDNPSFDPDPMGAVQAKHVTEVTSESKHEPRKHFFQSTHFCNCASQTTEAKVKEEEPPSFSPPGGNFPAGKIFLHMLKPGEKVVPPAKGEGPGSVDKSGALPAMDYRVIRYTLDGTQPTKSSPMFRDRPLVLDNIAIVSAVLHNIVTNKLSPVVTAEYKIGVQLCSLPDKIIRGVMWVPISNKTRTTPDALRALLETKRREFQRGVARSVRVVSDMVKVTKIKAGGQEEEKDTKKVNEFVFDRRASRNKKCKEKPKKKKKKKKKRKLWVQVHYAIEMQKGLTREKGIRHNIKTRSTSHKLHTVDTTTAWTQDSSGVPTCGQPIAEEIVEMMKSSEFQTHLRQEITRQDAELGRQCAGIRVASVISMALWKAAKKGDIKTVRALLDYGIHPDTEKDKKSGWTPLMFASWNGSVEIAQLLLDHGADPLQTNAKEGDSAIHFASSAAIVDVLLAGKADPLQRDNGGKTALMYAGWAGARDVQKALLKQPGVDVNDRASNDNGGTAIHYAATTRHEACLKLLINAKGQMNCLSHDGRSPLHYAMQTNGAIEFLLKAKADVNKSGPTAVSVAHYAAENGQTEFLELLMKAKANLMAIDPVTGEMPLHFSVKEGKEETMRFILDSKVDVDLRDKRHKRTALMQASIYGHTSIQETLLVHYKADVNLSCDSLGAEGGMTAAHYAAFKGGYEALKVLLRHNVDIHARHIDGRTPLHLAVQLKKTDTMRLLLESKANIHEDPDSIDAAISNGDMEACRLLRRYMPEGDAHVAIVEKAAETARECGHGFIEAWLRGSLGFTPLHFACDARDQQRVRDILLADEYLETEAKSCSGLTPLAVAEKADPACGFLKANPEIVNMVRSGSSCWTPRRHAMFPRSFRRAAVTILMIRNRFRADRPAWFPVLRRLGRNHFLNRSPASQSERK